MYHISPDPKPRKRLEDKAFIEWLGSKKCLYDKNPSGPPHHDRKGYGDGKGSLSRKPDDYRAIECCPKCHNALHGIDKGRLKWMTERISREDIYKSQVSNLLEWAEKQGWAMDEIYEAILDAIIDRKAREVT